MEAHQVPIAVASCATKRNQHFREIRTSVRQVDRPNRVAQIHLRIRLGSTPCTSPSVARGFAIASFLHIFSLWLYLWAVRTFSLELKESSRHVFICSYSRDVGNVLLLCIRQGLHGSEFLAMRSTAFRSASSPPLDTILDARSHSSYQCAPS